MMILEADLNKNYIISKIQVKDNYKHRLQILGIIEGTKIKVNNIRKDKGIIIIVRGMKVGLSREISRGIEIF